MSPSIDLFGNNVELSGDSIEAGLMRRDQATLHERAARWQFLEDLRQGGEVHYIGDIEGGYLYQESELTFVDGHYAATLLLVLAIIERVLQGWLIDSGFVEEARKGTGKILKFLRRHDLLHSFILDEIDKLRRKRNHFAHFKTDDDEMRVDQRTVATRIYDPQTLMRKDAEAALQLVHQLYRMKRGRINIKKLGV